METESLIEALRLALEDESTIETDLVTAIGRQTELESLEAPLIRYPSGSGIRGSTATLARGMVERARAVGPQIALDEVVEFLNADHVPILQVSAIGGIKLRFSVTIDDELSLIPFDQMPEGPSKKYFLERQEPWAATAALIHLSCVRKDDFLQQGPAPSIPNVDRTTPEKMRIACLILSCVLRSPVWQLGYWSQAAPWIPFANAGAFLSWSRLVPLLERTLTPRLGEYFRRLYADYFAMKPGDRDSLAVSLDRLDRSMRPGSQVDSAIDLGIALENFFMSDREAANQEISFTIRARAARLLAVSYVHRKAVAALVNDLYKLRSKAVHRGRFSESKLTGVSSQDRIAQGQKLIARALRNSIRNRSLPDWEAIIFS